MPAEEYAAATGGSLKLKGVKSSSKVSKSHRKKRPKSETQSSSANLQDSAEKAPDDTPKPDQEPSPNNGTTMARTKSEAEIEDDLEAEISARNRGKTDAELRHEERRRRRVGYFILLHSLSSEPGDANSNEYSWMSVSNARV